MENTFTKLEELAASLKAYVNTRITSVKLSVAEKTAQVIANMIVGLVVAFVFICFLIFSSIALALWLGEWMGKPWAGFLIVAVLYLLLGFVVWIARVKFIRLPLMNILIKQFFSNDHESD